MVKFHPHAPRQRQAVRRHSCARVGVRPILWRVAARGSALPRGTPRHSVRTVVFSLRGCAATPDGTRRRGPGWAPPAVAGRARARSFAPPSRSLLVPSIKSRWPRPARSRRRGLWEFICEAPARVATPRRTARFYLYQVTEQKCAPDKRMGRNRRRPPPRRSCLARLGSDRLSATPGDARLGHRRCPGVATPWL